MNSDYLEKEREGLLDKIFEIREEITKKVEEWDSLVLKVIEIEKKIVNERHNENHESLSGGQS